MAYIRPDIEEFVAGLPEVQDKVEDAAERGADRIATIVAPHIRTGRLYASIGVSRSFKGKDRWINIGGDGIDYLIPVNYGFWHVRARRLIHGIHAIEAAAGGG